MREGVTSVRIEHRVEQQHRLVEQSPGLVVVARREWRNPDRPG
jgi:hypothetical protein